MVEIKTPGEIDAIRAAGRVVAHVLAASRGAAAPGVTLKELDEAARDVLARAGATSPFLNYHPKFAPVPYPAVICTSVNDAALHGIPGSYRLQEGDLLSVDAGATLDGWVGDAAISFTVGRSSTADTELINATESALAAGIAAARPGGRLGDISAAIGHIGRAGGYGISTDLGGDGGGRGWCSGSSRGSSPAARTASGSTTTGGRSAPRTAAGPRTPSTPSRSRP